MTRQIVSQNNLPWRPNPRSSTTCCLGTNDNIKKNTQNLIHLFVLLTILFVPK